MRIALLHFYFSLKIVNFRCGQIEFSMDFFFTYFDGFEDGVSLKIFMEPKKLVKKNFSIFNYKFSFCMFHKNECSNES